MGGQTGERANSDASHGLPASTEMQADGQMEGLINQTLTFRPVSKWNGFAPLTKSFRDWHTHAPAG